MSIQNSNDWEKVVEAHARYRKYGQTVLGALIVFTTAIIGWILQESLTPGAEKFCAKIILWISIVSFGISMFCGFRSQFLYWEGYKKEAQLVFKLYKFKVDSLQSIDWERFVVSSCEPKIGEEWKKEWEDMNKTFSNGDDKTKCAFLSFLFGLFGLLAFIIYSAIF